MELLRLLNRLGQPLPSWLRQELQSTSWSWGHKLSGGRTTEKPGMVCCGGANTWLGIRLDYLIWNPQQHTLKELQGFSWCSCFTAERRRHKIFLKVLAPIGGRSQWTLALAPDLLLTSHECWASLQSQSVCVGQGRGEGRGGGVTPYTWVCCGTTGLGDQQVWAIKNMSDRLNMRWETPRIRRLPAGPGLLRFIHPVLVTDILHTGQCKYHVFRFGTWLKPRLC